MKTPKKTRGLYPLSTIARFLGKRRAEMVDLIKLDGLPVILVPGRTRPAHKVMLAPFHRWLSDRAQGGCVPTLEELREALVDCAEGESADPETEQASHGKEAV